MLFARLQLDSFDDELDESYNLWDQGTFVTDVEWSRIASINIAALYQYNRKDSLLKEALRQGRREKREVEQEESVPVEESINEPDTILPPSTQTTETLQTDMMNLDPAPEQFTNIPADIRSGDKDDVSLSKIVFEKSCDLTFGLFSEILNSHAYDEGPRMYIHVMLVFLAYALRYQPVVRLLERKIPWQELAYYLSDLNEYYLSDVEEYLIRDLPLENLAGPVLLEDTVIRGFEWSRKLFPKGWFENVDWLFEDLECTDDGWRLRLDDPPENEPGTPAREADERRELRVNTARKQRVLTLGMQITKVSPPRPHYLCQICDCLVFEHSVFDVSDAVKARIAAAEEEEAREAKRLEDAAQAAREAAMMESLVEEAQDQHESDEDADVEGESEELRALKVSNHRLTMLMKRRGDENSKRC